MLWQLVMALFWIKWVMPSTVREALFGLAWIFLQEEEEKNLESYSFVFILDQVIK